MDSPKKYQLMSDSEKQEWLASYQQWLVDFKGINLDALDSSLQVVFERGLALFGSFSYCWGFIAESRKAKDYSRRLKLMQRYADRITADLERMVGKSIDLTDQSLLIPHVGRPTKEQSAAKAILKQKQEEEEKSKPNLFNSDGSAKGEAGVFVNPIPNRRLSVAEIKWLLSPALQSRAEMIRDLRARFEESSTRAKQMAEDGRSPSDIEPYAKQATQDIEAVESIYADIDKELQTVYVRLKEDSSYIEKIEAISRLDSKELRTMLRQYWDKLSLEEKEAFKAKVIEQIKASNPAQAAARTAEEEKKKRISGIVKYLQRKDKPNTLARLKGMEERINQLSDLIGTEAEIYMPLLTAAREDYEKNVKPLQEAKRVERELKKASKKTNKS